MLCPACGTIYDLVHQKAAQALEKNREFSQDIRELNSLKRSSSGESWVILRKLLRNATNPHSASFAK